MKKDFNSLVGGLILFGFATLMLIVWFIWDIPFIPDKLGIPVFVFLWTLQLSGVINIGAFFVKPKPNYRWKQLKDKKIFEVIFISKNFEDLHPVGNSEEMLVVSVSGFGETLMSFPKNLKSWKGTEGPMKGCNYMKVDNYFIKI
jgi:hypothetical protein